MLERKPMTTVLRRGLLAIRLQVTNGAIVATKEGLSPGSARRDAWFGPLDVDLFESMARFGEAHQAIKGLFFGLMKPEFLR